jgi:hypothetical protein
MRIASSAHTAQPWLIHEITRDFRVEDVWALPTPGGPDDFPILLSAIEHDDFEHDGPVAARMLWWLRWKLGGLLGLDRRATGLGARVHSLRDRLPAELREATPAERNEGSPFSVVYQAHNERASEIANRTVHAVLHLGWVPDGAGGWHGQMAILVKPNGALGTAYMALIKPFRKLIIYPAILRSIERRWQDRPGQGADPSAAV